MSLGLKQNVYGLPHFGFKPRDLGTPDPDLLAPIRYSCVFLADHPCDVNGQSNEYKQDLTNDGGSAWASEEAFPPLA